MPEVSYLKDFRNKFNARIKEILLLLLISLSQSSCVAFDSRKDYEACQPGALVVDTFRSLPNNNIKEIYTKVLAGVWLTRNSYLLKVNKDMFVSRLMSLFDQDPDMAYRVLEDLLILIYADHGSMVSTLFSKISSSNCLFTEDLKQAVSSLSYSYRVDGNKRELFISLDLDPQVIIDILNKEIYANVKVVNFSFQVGHLQFKVVESIDDKGESRVVFSPVPPYDENNLKGKENLLSLVKIAHSVPEKLIIAASGNLGDNFYNIKRDLQESNQWPDNLLIVTDLPDFVNPEIEAGADIAVAVSSFGAPSSSSFATVIVSAIVDVLFANNPDLSFEEIIKLLKQDLSSGYLLVSYGNGSFHNPLYVLPIISHTDKISDLLNNY
ncbi:MAG: hypothetical protein KatS3mg090_0623 [Patescibacteria group bacterium]|nr:MAG: hypothetical protein KatS3mg090_0623 [Patescibacteria group bacterium]